MASTLQTMREGGTQHPEDIVNFLASRVIKNTGGIFDKDDNGSFLVSEETVPAMSVKVAEGYAFLRKSGDSMVYPVRLFDGDASATINANASGNDRIDAVVLYIDLGASPNSAVTNVAKLVVIEGTPAGSPSAPTDGDIESEIGASNPYLRIADVDVANGAVSIVDADITDQRSEVLFVSNGTPTADGDIANKGYVDTKAPADGWFSLVSAGTRLSAFVLTASGDLTGIIQKGDKIKLTNTTTKYFYVKSVSYSDPNTTITFYDNTDYVLVGNPTTIQYSKSATPHGFPKYFNYDGAISGFSSFTSEVYKFSIENGSVCVMGEIDGTSNATGHAFTLPATCAESGIRMPIYGVDNSTTAVARLDLGSTTASCYRTIIGNTWSSGVSNVIHFSISYLLG